MRASQRASGGRDQTTVLEVLVKSSFNPRALEHLSSFLRPWRHPQTRSDIGVTNGIGKSQLDRENAFTTQVLDDPFDTWLRTRSPIQILLSGCRLRGQRLANERSA